MTERCALSYVLVLLVLELVSSRSNINLVNDVTKETVNRIKRQDGNCVATDTTVRGGEACSGQVIFEEDFSTFRKDVWQIEHYIPVTSHQESPFVSYQNDKSLVYVADGYLHIAPKLQEQMPGFTNESIYLGTLDLFKGCTSRAEECYRQASGADILPPIASARVRSVKFAFTYGTIHVRAKMPQGDWLYPELLLEPYFKKYGHSNFASGVMKIAAARGNRELRVGEEEFGNEILYGGAVMNLVCRDELLSNKLLEDGQWGDQFHNYSLTWTPGYISLSVDGAEWARAVAPGGLRTRFHYTYCKHLPIEKLYTGTKMAPFDIDFYISLGVAAGGITEFPDDSYSVGGRQKPWRNSERKGMLSFWEDLPAWQYTWTQPELLIDHIKVVAL
ncbi:unnamed protein product [Chilo suppressalis]|uniref:GH16 domain-containing protein n=1 Tax=Chilo suppressalis TaxID=168631 RepID=A0ABN8ASS7_CHISP|nr:unnamed protein product [Chilo suppressalis]